MGRVSALNCDPSVFGTKPYMNSSYWYEGRTGSATAGVVPFGAEVGNFGSAVTLACSSATGESHVRVFVQHGVRPVRGQGTQSRSNGGSR